MNKTITISILLILSSMNLFANKFNLDTYLNAKRIDYQGLTNKLENIGYANMNKVHGNMVEKVSDSRFTGKGKYGKRIGEIGSNGIDGLYGKVNSSGITKEVLVTESKFGNASLRVNKDGTKQMSKEWILKQHDKLIEKTKKNLNAAVTKSDKTKYSKLLKSYEQSKYLIENDVYKAKLLKGDFIDGSLKVKITTLKGVSSTSEVIDIPFSNIDANKLEKGSISDNARNKVFDQLQSDYDKYIGEKNSKKIISDLKEGRIKNKADLIKAEHKYSNDYLLNNEIKRIKKEKGFTEAIKAKILIKEQFKVNQFYRDFRSTLKDQIGDNKAKEILSKLKKSNNNSLFSAKAEAGEILKKSGLSKKTLSSMSGKTIKSIRRVRAIKKVLRVAGVAGIAIGIAMDVYEVGKLFYDYSKGQGNRSILIKNLVRFGASAAIGGAFGALGSLLGPVGTIVGFFVGYTIGGFLVDSLIDIPQTKYRIIQKEESFNNYIDYMNSYVNQA